jgi:hypothetical protein
VPDDKRCQTGRLPTLHKDSLPHEIIAALEVLEAQAKELAKQNAYRSLLKDDEGARDVAIFYHGIECALGHILWPISGLAEEEGCDGPHELNLEGLHL